MELLIGLEKRTDFKIPLIYVFGKCFETTAKEVIWEGNKKNDKKFLKSTKHVCLCKWLVDWNAY